MNDQRKTKKASIQELNALRYSEGIINTVREPLIVLDQDLRVVTANRSFYDVFKVNPEETVGQFIYDLGNKQWDIPELRELLETILPKKTTFDNYEVEHDFATIGKRIMLLNARQIKRALGKERIILLAIEDITERMQIERSLIENEARLRTLVQAIPDLIWLKDIDGVYLACNSMFERFFGAKETDIIGKTDYDFVDKELADSFREHDRKAMAAGKPSSNEEWITFADDGHRVLLDTIKTPMFNVEGELIGVLGIARDITKRKQKEQALRDTEERFAAAFHASPNLIAITRMADGKIVDVNEGYSKMLGYSRDESIGKTTAELSIWADSADRATFVGSLEKFGEVNNFETTLRHKNGTHIPVLDSGRIIELQGEKCLLSVAHDITERKQAESLYKILMGKSLVAVFIVQDGKFSFINTSAIAYAEYDADELVGRDADTIVYPEDREMVKKKGRAMLRGDHPVPYEFRMVTKQGQIRWILQIVSPIEYKGHPAILGNAMDITERKRVEDALRQSEEKYRSILEDIQEGYFEVDFAGNFTFFNDSLRRFLDYSQEELMGMNYLQYTDKEYSKILFQAFNKVYNTGEPTEGFDWQIIRKNGTKRYVEASILLQKNSSGKPIGFRGIARDVTERKRTEEALKNSEEKYRLLADNIQDVIFVLDMNLKYTYISPSVKIMRGYEPEEILKQQSIEQTLTPSSRSLALKAFSEIIELEKSEHGEIPLSRTLQLEMRRKDGTTLWTDVRFSFIRDENKRPMAIMGVSRDITERKKVEDELRKSEARYHGLFEHMSEGFAYCRMIFENDEPQDFIYLDVNNAFENLTGLRNVTGKKVSEVIPGLRETDPQIFTIYARVSLTGKSEKFEIFIEALKMWFSVSVYGPEKEHFIAVFDVITDRKKAEEQLHQTLYRLKKAVGTTIAVLGTASETRDPYTAGHQKRVADLARTIATEMGLSQDKIEGIRMAGSIHDIGKLSIPAEILSKPTKLTDLEFSLIKEHPRIGYEMLKDVESPWPLAEIVYQHHERMNGSGYPGNLKGDEILIEARIMAVADVVEAMASYRPYRPGLGIEAALEEIEKNKGILYDNVAADACLRLFREKGYQLT
ncbi:MAG: PAS domain S-box protein [Smithella sp.]